MMYPKLPPSAIRDNYDEDDLSDIDDEVFIRDGKSGILKIVDDDCADKRPLMAPRRKTKIQNMDKHALPYKVLFAPFCYGILALIVLLGLIMLGIFTINVLFPMPLSILRNWLPHRTAKNITETEIIACTSLTYQVVWKVTLPKLAAEAPLRSSDVNGDSIEDIIIGFSIGLDMLDSIPEYVCTVYFKGQTPCLGGVMALDGKTGKSIWTHWTAHAVFAVDCGLDLTKDNIKDCVVSGRGGILHAINGRDGSLIWEMPIADFTSTEQKESLNVFDAKFITDVDGDQVGDIVASHILQIEEVHKSKIILISGRTGAVIRSVNLPETEQLFVAPQTLIHPDGENIFVLATNSQQKTGGLYIIPQTKIMQGEMKLQKLHHSPGKGVSLPPILADITNDGTEDIIAAMFSSTVIAFDGLTFKQMWNYTIPGTEIISVPIPGYYNDDDVPDFMVKHQIGPGFPIYYYTTATILDGKTGKPLLEQPIEDTMSAQMSGLSITVDDFGNDWFLYWSADCLNHEGEKAEYRFVEGQTANAESRANLCKLRFNSTLSTKLYAMSQHVGPPGLPLYISQAWQKTEFANFMDPREEAERFMEQQAKNIQNKPVQYELEDSPREKHGHFYPRGRNDNYPDSEIPENVNLAIKETEDELGLNDNWQDGERNGKMYDDTLYDDSARSDEPSRSNDFRPQRSKEVRYHVDPIMDYSNSKSVNNTAEVDDHLDDMYPSVMDDVDFVDNEINEAQVEKREVNKFFNKSRAEYNTIVTSTNSALFSTQQVNPHDQINFAQNEEDAKIEKIFKRESMKNFKRYRRDLNNEANLADGVQRQPPTGVLLPSLTKGFEDKSRPLDLVFSTYWLPSSEVPFVLIQQDLDCIQNKKAQLVNMPQRRDDEKIMSECLAHRGVDYKIYQESLDKENRKIALGQMTVYRISIKCVCPEDALPGQSCKNISTRQSWPAHLGDTGNGFFRPFRKVQI